MAEVNEGLDVIANHDNVPPFICRLLIQRLVKSNPSRGYMRRVTRVFRDNGQGQRGDFKAVVKAILLDPEAVRGQRLVRRSDPLAVKVVTRGSEHSRLREPIQRITTMILRCDQGASFLTPAPGNPAQKVDPATGETFMMLSHSIEQDIGQMPFKAAERVQLLLARLSAAGRFDRVHTLTPHSSRRTIRSRVSSPERRHGQSHDESFGRVRSKSVCLAWDARWVRAESTSVSMRSWSWPRTMRIFQRS